jgi:hypothetical protein
MLLAPGFDKREATPEYELKSGGDIDGWHAVQGGEYEAMIGATIEVNDAAGSTEGASVTRGASVPLWPDWLASTVGPAGPPVLGGTSPTEHALAASRNDTIAVLRTPMVGLRHARLGTYLLYCNFR